MAQKFDARQTISRDVLSQLLGINGTELDDLLRAINKEFNAPLRISASSPADAKINFQPSEVEAADLAAKNITPVSSQIPSFPASTIDFQTGATTGGTINITFPNSTVGFFRRIGFSLDASGTIQAIFSAEAATIGALANAGTVFVKGALPIGWIDLEATAASPGRFKTAGSATNIIENKVGSDNRVHRIMGGGGTGAGGSGSGTGDDINALTFKASFTDLFSDLPTDAVSAVDYSAGKTDASTYDIVNTYHRLAYDATLTVTGTGVNMTLSAPPVFTIKTGDMLVVGSEARRIASLTSQTVFALESAFSTDPSAAACNVSQAVHSKDLNNFAGDGLAVSTAFPTAINQILMTYEDTTAANDIIFDANTVAVIGFTASSDGSNYTNVQIRPQNLSDSQSIVNLPTSGTNLYLRLFANKTSGSGFVNILGYKAFFHRDLVYADGSVLNQAYARTDNSGTKINVSAISVVSGKTRVKTSFSFAVGVNSGSPNGSIKVYLDGQKLPRFVDGTVSITAYYKEIDQNTIELDADYSSLPLELEIVQDVAVVDASDTNTTGVAQLQETLSEGTQSFIKTSSVLNATTNTGTPAVGTFHSTIQNRASITDLTQDLKARMGIERISTQQLYLLESEFGPNGEPVRVPYNDNSLIRFVGSGWTSLLDNDGPRPFSATLNDFVEITFYGTGLNVLESDASGAKDIRASLNGGAEGGATIRPTMQGILQNRNTSPNIPLAVYSGLPLGVHTVKLRLNSGNISIHGFEILNESTSVRVNPGSSFVAGRKSTTLSQAVFAYNSSFESGTLGTRGGRVVVYQKADGSIAKAVQPVDASQANLTSANHQNEEVVRSYHFREFGANFTDDYSLRVNNTGASAFTLEDGTTTLTSSGAGPSVGAGGEALQISSVANSFATLVFVGTGLDIVQQDSANGTLDTYSVTVDGVNVGNLSTTASTATRTTKIVSGLPYGTHTVRILRTVAVNQNLGILRFVVYQPKKPTLPAGAIELADYNVMADYSGTTITGTAVADNIQMPVGCLYKAPAREYQYVGANQQFFPIDVGSLPGLTTTTLTNNSQPLTYTFFGTGFVLHMGASTAGTYDFTVNIDGALNSTGVARSNASNLGSGSYRSTASTNAYQPCRIEFTGLTMARHTVTIQRTAGTGNYTFQGMHIITPIHSTKSNLYADLQNTLPVGSNAISDNRKTSALKDATAQPKASAQALGVVSNPTTTSTSFLPLPDLSAVLRTNSGKIKISYSITVSNATANQATSAIIYINGVAVSTERFFHSGGSGLTGTLSDILELQYAPGVYKVDVYWRVAGGTGTATLTSRTLLVEEE